MANRPDTTTLRVRRATHDRLAKLLAATRLPSFYDLVEDMVDLYEHTLAEHGGNDPRLSVRLGIKRTGSRSPSVAC